MTITRSATLALAAAATAVTTMTGAAMAQDNYKEKIRIFYDTFNKNDPALLDKIIAEDWVHIPANTPGEDPGREGFKNLIPGFAATFKDRNLKIEDIVQEGNKVAVRSSYTATQVGPFMGFAPKGRQSTIMSIDVHEFNKDGMVQTTWHLEDWLGGTVPDGRIREVRSGLLSSTQLLARDYPWAIFHSRDPEKHHSC